MYWFLTGSPSTFLPFLLLTALWWLGGWLLATHLFRLERRERVLVGFGVGLAGFTWFANLIGHWASPPVAFWGGGVLVLGLGVSATAFRRRIREDNEPERNAVPSNAVAMLRDWFEWPAFIAWVILSGIFFRISQGTSLFDEHAHLPLISTMAYWNLPPHHFFNPDTPFAYHYGFHFLGASMMRLGGLFPWSAFDLSKAVLWGYTVLLAWLIGRRMTSKPILAALIPAVLVFGLGTRYLMFFLPPALLQQADPLIHFEGVEAAMDVPFSESLPEPWVVDGGPPVPFIFGFLNGFYEPLILAHAGLNIFQAALFLLIWLLAGRLNKPLSTFILAVVLAVWALTWETSYALFVIGGLLASGIQGWHFYRQNKPDLRSLVRQIPPEAVALIVSGVFALAQGGLLTETSRELLFGGVNAGNLQSGSVGQLTLRWPPVLINKHFGALSLFSPILLVIALFDLGPLMLFVPAVTRWAWRRFGQGEWVMGALIISAWVGFLGPVLVGYQHSVRDVARVGAHGLLVWGMFLALRLVEEGAGEISILRLRRSQSRTRSAQDAVSNHSHKKAAIWTLALTMVSGLVVTGISLTASAQGVLSYRIDKLDAQVAREVWGRLPPGATVFDPSGERATMLTGLATHYFRGNLSFGVRATAEWEALKSYPTIEGFLAEGFSFVYADDKWWRETPEEAHAALSVPCVVVVAESWDDARIRFRRLLDLRGCE